MRVRSAEQNASTLLSALKAQSAEVTRAFAAQLEQSHKQLAGAIGRSFAQGNQRLDEVEGGYKSDLEQVERRVSDRLERVAEKVTADGAARAKKERERITADFKAGRHSRSRYIPSWSGC